MPIIKQIAVGLVHGANSSSNEQALVDENFVPTMKKVNSADNKTIVATTATMFAEGNEELKHDQSSQIN